MSKSLAGQAIPVQKREWQDYGLFGPGSPSWKVWASPTALIGFQRAVVLEHFDPFLAAAVADMQGIYRDPLGRLDRTLAYFLTVAVADARAVVEASEILMRVHAKATGIEPITGKRYSANNPESQLWIHVTGWHSVLKCYEMYGAGPLAPAEEKRYWSECVTAAELQTCKPADVPRTRDEVRDYYAAVRPRLCSSERAYRGMHYLLRSRGGGRRIGAASRLMAPATIATLPAWMRKVGGFDQPAVVDRAVAPAARAVIRGLGERGRFVSVLADVAPATARIARQHLHRTPPADPRTYTPAEARDLFDGPPVRLS
ncbi:oxygenase MpaB family protein [Fodinicola acaciae]|uniref:oxygenase MpaB family protein n=1 Tax=Fodinicola acaciae TaxID=2681555 RepID=UPI0013CF7444|nr:oxygenase MpaB family protein [Fodinicola acaciae]